MMKHIKYFCEYSQMNELFVHGNINPNNGDTIIAFRENLWIVNKRTFPQYRSQILFALKHQKNPIETIDELIDILSSDPLPDVLIGELYDGDLVLYAKMINRHSLASTTLQKVIQKLNLNYVSIENGPILYYKDFDKDLKNLYFYHGTTYDYLIFGIYKYGLKPSPQQSNYTSVIHTDKVFVTLNMEDAYEHAIHSATTNQSFPVIIKLKIPDIDKLVPDYDVQLALKGIDDPLTRKLGYSKLATINDKPILGVGKIRKDTAFYRRQKDNKEDLIKKMGVFGYLGRIPSSYIHGIVFDSDLLNEFLSYKNELTNYDDYIQSYYDLNNDSLIDDWIYLDIDGFKTRVDHITKTIQKNKKELLEDK